MPDKYLSFDGWWGGLNNIRMTYEMAAALSVLTNRTLIIPPKIYCLFLSEHDQKDSFFDFWNLFDKELFYKYFDCIDYKDVPEYKKYESDIQYFDGICNDIKCLPETEHPNWGVNGDTYFKPINVFNFKHEDKFIHFPRNLFGHWYHLIGGINSKLREKIKHKIKHGIKLKSHFNKRFIPKPYNAIHVRSGDFNQTRPDSTVKLFTNLRDMVDTYLKPDKPLYIATDENNRKLFECLNGYECYYLSDFINTDMVSSIAYDTLMCANAELFHGSRYSTFTDYINIIRYYNNKKNCSKKLLNYRFNGKETFSWENCFVNEY
jgi:hypothetical protein